MSSGAERGDSQMPRLPEFNLPVDEQLEREILGSCFGEDRTGIANVRAVLDVSEFGNEDHRRIYQSLCRLADAGEPLLYTRVHADMAARSLPITLDQLMALEGFPWALDRLLRRAKELAGRRALIMRGYEVMLSAADLSVPLADVTQRATAAIREAAGEAEPADA